MEVKDAWENEHKVSGLLWSYRYMKRSSLISFPLSFVIKKTHKKLLKKVTTITFQFLAIILLVKENLRNYLLCSYPCLYPLHLLA